MNAVRFHFCAFIPALSFLRFHFDGSDMSRLDEMLRFLEQDPNDSFARYAVALELRSQKRMAEAIAELEELRRRDASYGATYYQLGELLAESGEIDRAAEAFRAGIEVARAAGDHHTRSELEAALDELDDLR
jgi:tetratricopeptide (TPR) repeat protein